MMNIQNKIILFQEKQIRRVLLDDIWHFAIVDVIEVLTDSPRARKYWNDLKKKLLQEGAELSAKIGQLWVETIHELSWYTMPFGLAPAFSSGFHIFSLFCRSLSK